MGRETAGGGLEMGTQQQGNQRSSEGSAVFIGRASFRMSPVNQVEDHPEPLPEALLMTRPATGNTGSRTMARAKAGTMTGTMVRSVAHQSLADDTHGDGGQTGGASSFDLDWFNRGEDNLVLTPPRAGADAAYDLLADDEFPREGSRGRSAPVWTLLAALVVGATVTLSAQAVLRRPERERMVDSVKQLVNSTQRTSETVMTGAIPSQAETSPAPSLSFAPSKPSPAAVGPAPPSGAVAAAAPPASLAPPAPALDSAYAPRPSARVAVAPASAPTPATAPTVVLSTALWAATEPRPPVRTSVPAPGEHSSRARLARTAPARAAAVTPPTAAARRSGGDAWHGAWIDPFAGTDLEPIAPAKKTAKKTETAADPKTPEQGSRLKMVSSLATPAARHPNAPGSTSWVDPFAQ